MLYKSITLGPYKYVYFVVLQTINTINVEIIMKRSERLGPSVAAVKVWLLWGELGGELRWAERGTSTGCGVWEHLERERQQPLDGASGHRYAEHQRLHTLTPIRVIIIMEDIWIWGRRDFRLKVLSLPSISSTRLLIRFLLNVCFSEIGPDWMISLLLWKLVLLVIVLVRVRQRNIVSCTKP